MDGIELETVELAYLLATVGATRVIGVEDARLFPAEGVAREATFSAGLEALQAHGWMKPIPQYPGEFDLDSTLLYMVAIVAEPEFVVSTSRQLPEGGRQLVLHYLADDAIVELTGTAGGGYRLGFVTDRATLVARLGQVLAVSDNIAGPFTFTLDESVLTTLRDLIAQGQHKQAKALLKQSGINGASGESFITALQSPVEGEVVIIRPDPGEEILGRRAWVFGEPPAWLVRRMGADTTQMRVETAQPDTLSRLLEDFIEFLAAPV